MRLHRFYISETIGIKTELTIHSSELVNQIHRVFRLKTGDPVIIFDGSGLDHECTIVGFEKESVALKVVGSNKSRFVPDRDIYLCAAVVKKDTFEWIVEKATELGVTHIIPVIAERSEKKALNEGRLKKIAIEASEQSGRGSVPEILPIKTLEETVEYASDPTRFSSLKPLVFHTEGRHFDRNTMRDSDAMDADSPLALFIGPEGGWSPGEIELFHKNNIPVVCLGDQVLRAETAVIAALSQVVFDK